MMRLFIVLFFLLATVLSPAYALTTSPLHRPTTEVQPDGSTIRVLLRGDRTSHHVTDKKGTPLCQNGSGFYVPCGPEDGAHAAARNATAARTRRRRRAPPRRVFKDGSFRHLVLPIRFRNHRDRALPHPAAFKAVLDWRGGHWRRARSGSLADYVVDNAHGRVTAVSSVIRPYRTVEMDEAEYADGVSGSQRVWEAVVQALEDADRVRGFDFSRFDNDGDGVVDSVTIFHSGYGAEHGGTSCDRMHYHDRIWAHNDVFDVPWVSKGGVSVRGYFITSAVFGKCGNSMARLGGIAQGVFGNLGLPILYDTDDSSYGAGNYDLMANAWGADGTQYHPPNLSAYTKILLGWADVTTIKPQWNEFRIAPSATTGQVFRLLTRGFAPEEYFLIENRQPLGFDAKNLPVGGLAIWHLDLRNGNWNEGHPWQDDWPKSNRHYGVALLQADGRYHLERGLNAGDGGDLFRMDGVGMLGPSKGPWFKGPFPNTDAYIARKTLFKIVITQESEQYVSFQMRPHRRTPKPTIINRPSSPPTDAPTFCHDREPGFCQIFIRNDMEACNTPLDGGDDLHMSDYCRKTCGICLGSSSPSYPPTHYPTVTPTAKVPTKPATQTPTQTPTECHDDDGSFCFLFVEPNKFVKCRAPRVAAACQRTCNLCPGATLYPSARPSGSPSAAPSAAPTAAPSWQPSDRPSASPSGAPSDRASAAPSDRPSASPSGAPSDRPAGAPSLRPSGAPSERPSVPPSSSPSLSSWPSPAHMPSRGPSGAPAVTHPPSRGPSHAVGGIVAIGAAARPAIA